MNESGSALVEFQSLGGVGGCVTQLMILRVWSLDYLRTCYKCYFLTFSLSTCNLLEQLWSPTTPGLTSAWDDSDVTKI